METPLDPPKVSLDGTRGWHGSGVKVADVARELRLLRAMAGDDMHSTLTSVMNLVAWAPTEGAAAGLERIADDLRDHHPSRVVIVIPSDGGDGLDARVEVLCHPDRPGGRALHFEQIVLHLHGAVASHAGSVVIPLIRSELPTFLWWPAAPDVNAPVFRDLGRVADRLITETGRELRGPDAVDALLHAISAAPVPLTDLAWGAITPWRQMVASMLRGAALEHARSATPATATVLHPPGTPALEVHLLGGWLRDALGEGLAVRLSESDGGDDDVLGIRLDVAGDLLLSIVRDAGEPTVTVVSPSGATRCVPLHPRSRGMLLAGELEHRGRDTTLERALSLAPSGARA